MGHYWIEAGCCPAMTFAVLCMRCCLLERCTGRAARSLLLPLWMRWLLAMNCWLHWFTALVCSSSAYVCCLLLVRECCTISGLPYWMTRVLVLLCWCLWALWITSLLVDSAAIFSDYQEGLLLRCENIPKRSTSHHAAGSFTCYTCSLLLLPLWEVIFTF